MFTGRSNSSSSDLSVRGYLPPKGKQVEASLLLSSLFSCPSEAGNQQLQGEKGN